jgi:Uma2 family endonuclease
MTAVAKAPSVAAAVAEVDQRMVLFGVRWKEYELLRETLDTPGLRMTYCEGTLELLRPSRTHELHKKSCSRLVELYAFLRDLPLIGYGSTTFRHEAKERGAEPDECYCVGRMMKDGEFPDIVLEVIHASPLLDKLHVYKGFGVSEVWLFRNSAFELYRLANDAYEPIARSAFLPELDFALIARLAGREDQHEALRELRSLL